MFDRPDGVGADAGVGSLSAGWDNFVGLADGASAGGRGTARARSLMIIIAIRSNAIRPTGRLPRAAVSDACIIIAAVIIVRAPVTRATLRALMPEQGLLVSGPDNEQLTAGALVLFGKRLKDFFSHAVMPCQRRARNAKSTRRFDQLVPEASGKIENPEINPPLKVKKRRQHDERKAGRGISLFGWRSGGIKPPRCAALPIFSITNFRRGRRPGGSRPSKEYLGTRRRSVSCPANARQLQDQSTTPGWNFPPLLIRAFCA